MARASILAAACFSSFAPPNSNGQTSTRAIPAPARTIQRVTISSTTPVPRLMMSRPESPLRCSRSEAEAPAAGVGSRSTPMKKPIRRKIPPPMSAPDKKAVMAVDSFMPPPSDKRRPGRNQLP